MKLSTRVKLLCSKPIREGHNVLDQFSVVVLRENEGAARNTYESMGYKVSRVTL